MLGRVPSTFLRLAGRRLYAPPVLAIVQTDGTFRHSNGSATVTARITKGHELVDEAASPLYNLASVTEAEWASVYYGLLLAQANREGAVGLENDCLRVVNGLVYNPYANPRPYAVYYRCKIMDAAEGMDWCGIRWIPRGRTAWFSN